jgi:hypothetical protein
MATSWPRCRWLRRLCELSRVKKSDASNHLRQTIVVAIYRLTLHPLAKYPGPFLSKISYWPTVFNAASGDRHLVQYREHEIYGS